jgi:ribosomal peptide maturation radical SAM protein 1
VVTQVGFDISPHKYHPLQPSATRYYDRAVEMTSARSASPLGATVNGAGRPAPPQRVALVNMPFAAAQRPSIQCGLLKASLVREGHAVDVHYLNLELAVELGADVYARLADIRSDHLLGEWLFSVAAFGPRSDEEEYRRSFPSLAETCETIRYSFEDLCRLRNETLPAIVDRWAAATDWAAYDAVGFTSTFEQNVAALALARRLKERYPDVVTVFGGANYDGEMGPEYVRAFPWIDYAVVGEGDTALPAIVACLGRGDSAAGLPGVVARVGESVVKDGSAPLVRDLDGLPDPDYDEFFGALMKLGRENVLGDALPLLLFESARGCWWGEKHHCTFCGLNALGMAYRSKSPERVHAELRRQSARYQIVNFEAVDNIIDMRYLDELCKPLIDERYDYRLFYEVKSNLKRAQLRTLSQAGVGIIQPGIESLSTHILKLMRKGATMLQNVRVLKWGHYYGIKVAWNLLSGFPGETVEDYEEQERLIPKLWHLPPPVGGGPIWMERFSPYFTDSAFPVESLEPWSAYRFVYPQESVDLHKIAYFFDYTMGDVVPDEQLVGVRRAMNEWRDSWKQPSPPVLAYQRAPDWIQIVDRRRPDAPKAHAFQGVAAAVYDVCSDTDHSASRVLALLREDGIDAGAEDVEEALATFCDLDLMIGEDGSYLSLALPVNGNW